MFKYFILCPENQFHAMAHGCMEARINGRSNYITNNQGAKKASSTVTVWGHSFCLIKLFFLYICSSLVATEAIECFEPTVYELTSKKNVYFKFISTSHDQRLITRSNREYYNVVSSAFFILLIRAPVVNTGTWQTWLAE